jgi:hypothetical protein
MGHTYPLLGGCDLAPNIQPYDAPRPQEARPLSPSNGRARPVPKTQRRCAGPGVNFGGGGGGPFTGLSSMAEGDCPPSHPRESTEAGAVPCYPKAEQAAHRQRRPRT